MKKTLIALAVGSAFAAPAAYADVTLSGSINAGPAYVNQGDGSTGTKNTFAATGATAQKGVSSTGINSNYSNITIGSLEDLGGGLKLDFGYQLTAPINGNNNTQNRNSHIGLVSDSWGGVWWGTNENLYESYFYTVDPLDGAAGLGGNLQMLGTPGFGSVFDAPNGASAYGPGTPNADFYRRVENDLWYNSPNFNGFTFGAYTSLNSFQHATAPGVVINPRVWGVGGKYVGTSLPIQAWIAYEGHHDLFGLNVVPGQLGSGTSSKDYGIQFGVGYTFGDIFAYFNFEHLDYKNSGVAAVAGLLTEYKRNAESIGVKWNVATGYFGGQVILAQTGSCTAAVGACNADNTGAWMIGLGYYHTLSKQTQAYIMGSYEHNDSLQSYLVAGGGSFSGGAGVPVNLGSKIFGLTVGLKHSF
jgi:predicted porin